MASAGFRTAVAAAREDVDTSVQPDGFPLTCGEAVGGMDMLA